MTRYSVLGMGRSGTTVTHRCIAGHPEVAALSSECGPSPFWTHGITTFTYGGGCSAKERELGYLRLFDAVCGAEASNRTAALGLKCAMNTATDAQAVVASIRAHFPAMKVIFTHRSDLVAQYASLLQARRTGVWYTHSKTRTGWARAKIAINVWDFMRYVEEAFRVNQILRSLEDCRDFCEISFERDISGGELEYAHRIFKFLGVAAVPITWLDLEKVSPPVCEFIENHVELEGILERMRARFESGEPAIAKSDLRAVRRREQFLELRDRLRRGWTGARRVLSFE